MARGLKQTAPARQMISPESAKKGADWAFQTSL
jgi:hypothetical protein